MNRPCATGSMDALILAGGQGRRMGTGVAKARLPLGGQTLIERSLAVLRPRFHKVYTIARDRAGWDGQGEDLLTDDRPERGPLVGLARGLGASEAEWCFLVGCDMPFLDGAVIERMAQYAFGVDAVALRTGRTYQPLHAFYRRSCLPVAEDILRQGGSSVQDLFRNVRVRALGPEDLGLSDHDLLSFRDIDTPEDYAQAEQIILRLEGQRRVRV